jgi:small subunit ribosomal protein S16
MRLTRVGSKKNPIYRVVVADARSPRDGAAVEYIGRYNPQLNPSLIEIDADRARHWLSVGAQPSEPVRRLLQKSGIV